MPLLSAGSAPIKHECLSKLVLFGGASLRRTLTEILRHYHHFERNHQGKENMLLFPAHSPSRLKNAVACEARLGGLLKFYQRAA
jgi:hypothetical protein